MAMYFTFGLRDHKSTTNTTLITHYEKPSPLVFTLANIHSALMRCHRWMLAPANP
jgi:hypothetical protein